MSKKIPPTYSLDQIACMRTFLCVLDAQSFAAAARRTRLATSTLTRQISALEAMLGTPLLVRTQKQVVLTEAGKIYEERARGMLYEMEETVRLISEMNASPSGILKIISPIAFGNRYLSSLLPEFLRYYPDIQVDIRFSDRHSDILIDGFDIDIHEGENHLNNLIAHKIDTNHMSLCAAPAYLAAKGIPSSPHDLSGHNCLRYLHPDADPYWHFQTDNQMVSILPTGSLQSDHTDLLLKVCQEGFGIADFEHWLVKDDIKAGRLVEVLPAYRLVNALTGQHIYIAYLPSRRHSAKVQAFKNFLLAFFAEEKWA